MRDQHGPPLRQLQVNRQNQLLLYATASSIFLTTFTDIGGMGLMLFLATSLLL
ncbi:MAG: hypothetical protein ACJARL_000538 [Halopseudomonas sp.]|jgi:hypothetical protein